MMNGWENRIRRARPLRTACGGLLLGLVLSVSAAAPGCAQAVLGSLGEPLPIAEHWRQDWFMQNSFYVCFSGDFLWEVHRVHGVSDAGGIMVGRAGARLGSDRTRFDFAASLTRHYGEGLSEGGYTQGAGSISGSAVMLPLRGDIRPFLGGDVLVGLHPLLPGTGDDVVFLFRPGAIFGLGVDTESFFLRIEGWYALSYHSQLELPPWGGVEVVATERFPESRLSLGVVTERISGAATLAMWGEDEQRSSTLGAEATYMVHEQVLLGAGLVRYPAGTLWPNGQFHYFVPTIDASAVLKLGPAFVPEGDDQVRSWIASLVIIARFGN